MTVHGIDVSVYQPAQYDTDGLGFVIIKATEGRSYINPRMKAQAKHARDVGLVVGFYHFLWPGDITAQAAYFVEKCASVEGDLLAVDWETTGSGSTASGAEKDAFIREVQRLRGDTHRVILYCNTDFWLHRDTTSFAGDGLWIAHYGVAAGSPGIQAPWVFHQYTSSPVDTNVGDFTDRAALRAWATADNTNTTQEDDMQLHDTVTIANWVSDAFPHQKGLQDGEISVRTALGSGYGYAHIAADNSSKILAKLDAQAATIDKLADALGQADDIDVDALKDEIREAIESITVRLDTNEEANA